jgi:hypothetical protein
MREQMLREPVREPVRVLFHLNGYTKVMLERTEGLGMADGGIVWELPTERIPRHLRKIGSRFVVRAVPLSIEEEDDPAAIHDAKNRFEIFELGGE